MPITAKFYVGITVGLGFALLSSSLIFPGQFPDLTRYLACVALACIASTMKVRLPGMHGTMSVNFVFILMAIAQLSFAETVTMALAATLVQCMWRTKTRPRLIQVVFSACTVMIAAGLAYRAAHLVPGEVHTWAALAPAATIFFVLNTGMISLVLALLSQKSVLAIWRQCHLWTFPYYLVGAAIAAGVNASSSALGWRISLLILPLMYLVYCFYASYVSGQKEQSAAL